MKKRCVIIDDASILRLRLRTILEREYEVVAEGENGNDAIAMYEQYKPDFMTLDITMAEKNGKDALREIIQKHPEAKVIMVTAVGTKMNVMDCIEIGAVRFIKKPFEEEQVLSKIREIFSV